MPSKKNRIGVVPVAQHLSLLQVLLILPVDVLRNSFGTLLSASDLRHLRLTCKEACQVVGSFTKCLCLKFLHTAQLRHIVSCIQKFTAVTDIRLQLSQPSKPSDVSPSFFSELLCKCKPQLKHVTKVTLLRMPVTHTGSLAILFACPNLQALELQRGCAIENSSAVFEPLTNLVSLTLTHVEAKSEDDREAAKSMSCLPNLQQVVMQGSQACCMFALANIESSRVRHVILSELDTQGVNALTKLPCLEILEIRRYVFYKVPCSGDLVALKHLKLKGWFSADKVFDLLSQPAIESIEWKDAALTIDVTWKNTMLPVTDWPAHVSAGLQSLQRLCKPGSFPFVALEGASAASTQVTSFLNLWPVIPECDTLNIFKVALSPQALCCLATRLPRISEMRWDSCAAGCDEWLSALPDFTHLRLLQLSGQTKVTAMGLALLATLLGQHEVRFLLGSPGLDDVDTTWVNSMLARIGVQSRFL